MDLIDTHICLSCQLPIDGLDNYIYHKKVSCPSKKQNQKTVTTSTPTTTVTVQSSSQHAVADIAVTSASELAPSTSQNTAPSNQLSQYVTSPDLSSSSQTNLLRSSPLSLMPNQLTNSSHTYSTTCSSDLSNMLVGSPPQQEDGPQPASMATTYNATPSRFSVVDPNMVLCNLPATSDVSTTDATLSIATPSEEGGHSELASGNPSIMDFLSSLELQCRATPSQGKLMSPTNQSEGDMGQMEDRSGVEARESDGLKLVSLLHDLNFDSDSEGFDMPSDAEDLLNFDEDYLTQSCTSETGKDASHHGKGKPKHHTGHKGKKGRTTYIGKWKPGERPISASRHLAQRHVSIGKRQYEDSSTDEENENHSSPLKDTHSLRDSDTPENNTNMESPKHRRLSAAKRFLHGETESQPSTTETKSNGSHNESSRKSYVTRQQSSKALVLEVKTLPSADGEEEDVAEDFNMDSTQVEKNVNECKATDMNKSLKCEPCMKYFKNRIALHNHTRSADHCHMVSLSVEERQKERQRMEEQKNAKVSKTSYSASCPSCDKTFNNKYNFARHFLSSLHIRKAKSAVLHLDLNFQKLLLRLQPFQCRICEFFCNSHDDLMLHLKTEQHRCNQENLTGPMCCVRCNFASNQAEEILDHFIASGHFEELTKSDRPCVLKEVRANITCKFCNKKVHSATAMKKHLKTHHNQRSEVNRLKSSVCPECFKDCKTKYNMTVHYRRHHSHEKPYSCDVCKRRFMEQSSLNMHYKSQKHMDNVLKASSILVTPGSGFDLGTASEERPKSKVYKCKRCDFCCDAYHKLRPHHIQEHSKQQKYVCEICGKKFLSRLLLSRHKESKTHKIKEKEADVAGHESFCCKHCGQKFYSKDKFSLHLLSHAPQTDKPVVQQRNKTSRLRGVPEKFHEFVKSLPKKPTSTEVTCPECAGTFKHAYIIIHLRSHGDPTNQPYKCNFCSKTFTSAPTLYRHHRGHLGIRPFQCNLCSQTFKSSPQLASHQLSKHKEQTNLKAQYQCSVCGLEFMEYGRFKIHCKYHDKSQKEYKCDFPNCNKSFVLKVSLQEHKRVHTGEKPYLCDLCGYATKTNTHMTRHKRVHTGECNYQCQYCNFKATHSWGLRRHMRIHIGSKPYKCPYCDYRCNCHTNLRHHVLSSKKHAGLTIYKCKMCDMGTNNAKEYQQHMISEHQVPEEEVENICVYAGIYIKENDTSTVAEGSQVLPVREKKPKITAGTKHKQKKTQNAKSHCESDEKKFTDKVPAQKMVSELVAMDSVTTASSPCLNTKPDVGQHIVSGDRGHDYNISAIEGSQAFPNTTSNTEESQGLITVLHASSQVKCEGEKSANAQTAQTVASGLLQMNTATNSLFQYPNPQSFVTSNQQVVSTESGQVYLPVNAQDYASSLSFYMDHRNPPRTDNSFISTLRQ